MSGDPSCAARLDDAFGLGHLVGRAGRGDKELGGFERRLVLLPYSVTRFTSCYGVVRCASTRAVEGAVPWSSPHQNVSRSVIDRSAAPLPCLGGGYFLMSSTARTTFLLAFSAGSAGSSLSCIVLFICSSHRVRPRRARPSRTHIRFEKAGGNKGQQRREAAISSYSSGRFLRLSISRFGTPSRVPVR